MKENDVHFCHGPAVELFAENIDCTVKGECCK
jgi:hypothetical protein